MLDLDVIDDPAAAVVALDPVRSKILAMLAEPGSSTTVAHSLGLTRQKVNYHLRILEEHGLVRLVEERPRRGLTERVVVATAQAYVVSPSALGDNAGTVERTDKLSTRYLIALAMRMVRDVAGLARAADAAGKPLATMSIDTDIRFASAADRSAFAVELTNAVTNLAARFHDERAPNGRWHRLIVATHPRPAHTQP
jgi:DNA-binding transcriptional ArsR family regulator